METPASSPSKVLIIDDSVVLCHLGRQLLSRCGCQVFIAHEGEEGVATALRERPDCIVVDWSMPGISGLEVCKRLRQRPETRDVPIVMFTVNATKKHVFQALAAGATDYLVKPVPPETFIRKIRGFIEGRKASSSPGAGGPEGGAGGVHGEGPPPAPAEGDLDIRKRVAKILADVHNLLPLSFPLHKVAALGDDSESCIDDLAKCIESDPAIASSILRLANSATMGRSRQVSRVKDAIVRLGFRNTRTRIIQMAVYNTVPRKEADPLFDRISFWRHSLACATLSRILVRRTAPRFQEDAYLAGLLHDIGKLVFDERLRPDFVKALDYAASNDLPLVDAEQEVLGTNHAFVGAQLAEAWKLPRAVHHAILRHPHDLVATRSEMNLIVGAVFLANQVIKALKLGAPGDLRIREPSLTNLSLFSVALRNLDTLRQDLFGQLEEAEDFLQVKRGLITGDERKTSPSPRSVALWVSEQRATSVCQVLLQASGFIVDRL
ncbi:MAG: response regulator, partial [Planctomycetes bacterium]|nr:response regulator [Planctomycetota bacterium]